MSLVATVADDSTTPLSAMYATRLADSPRSTEIPELWPIFTEMPDVWPRSTEIPAL